MFSCSNETASISQCLTVLHLLLCPQFAAWVDAVVFVFSLEDEISFQTVYNYFLRLASYRNTAEVPMVLVGTQGACITPDVYVLSGYCFLHTGDVHIHRKNSMFLHCLYT